MKGIKKGRRGRGTQVEGNVFSLSHKVIFPPVDINGI
jgi:hypothetical protein